MSRGEKILAIYFVNGKPFPSVHKIDSYPRARCMCVTCSHVYNYEKKGGGTGGYQTVVNHFQ